MVIVSTHVISSLLFYHKNPERFLKVDPVVSCQNAQKSKCKDSASANAVRSVDKDGEKEELTLSLLKCGDVDSLGAAVSKGICSCSPDIYGGALFYVDGVVGEVFTSDNAGTHACTPSPDCIRQAYERRQSVYCNVGAVPQCVLTHITYRDDRTVIQDCTVGCCPVIAEDGGEVYAVLVVVGKDFSESTASRLSWIQKQIAACYSHIQRTFQSQRGEERASQQLIKLCGELYDQDAASLQLKVIRYLEDQTQAECGFLLLVVPEVQELFCQVVGKKILQEEVRFPGHPSSFSGALESRQPVTLDDIPVENRKSIEELIEVPLHSFLCVPIMSRSDNSLIALACVANKRNANRFTDRDIACIRQCFRYTATVITSTIAFQNERKLKVQTQAMLQVARHLFTNLGEFIISHSWHVEDFPYITSRNCRISVLGNTPCTAVQRDIFTPHCHSVPSEPDCTSAASFPSIPNVSLSPDQELKDWGFVDSSPFISAVQTRSDIFYEAASDSSIEGDGSEKQAEENRNLDSQKLDWEDSSLEYESDESDKDDTSLESQLLNFEHRLSLESTDLCESFGHKNFTVRSTRQHTTNATRSSTPTNATRQSTPANSTRSSTPTNATRSSTPTNATRSSTPTNATRQSTPANSTRSSTPTNATRSSTPTNATRQSTPTNATRTSTPSNATRPSTPTNATNPGTSSNSTRPGSPTSTTRPSTASNTTPTNTARSGTLSSRTRPVTPTNSTRPGTPTSATRPGTPPNALADDVQVGCTVPRPADLSPPSRPGSVTSSDMSSSFYESCASDSGSSIDSYTVENLARELDITERDVELFFDTVDSVDEYVVEAFLHDNVAPTKPDPDKAAREKDLREELLLRKPAHEVFRSCHSDPASRKSQPTTADNKLKPNTALCHDTAQNASIQEINTSLHDPDVIYSLAVGANLSTESNDNPIVLIEDTHTGSSHKIDSSVSLVCRSSGELDRIDKNSGEPVIVNRNGDAVLVTVSDAHIADMQAPSTYVNSIKNKDLTKLLREVMQQARNLTNAERCSVFLIDLETDELVAKVFDGITTKKDNEVQEEIRMPCTQGIAGHVATSGELLNIKDAYSHPLFYRGIDDSTGFRTRNILCFPIKDDKGKILGVAQLCNKKNGPCFTQFDEDVATAFGIYCCISISHSLMYKKVIDSQIRNHLANELMMYHMKCLLYQKLQASQHRKSLANELMIYHMQVCPEDVQSLTKVDIPHPRMLNPDFVDFSYAPRSLPESKSPLGVLSMFEDLNFISRWKIRRETLARFVLMVKKGYRNPPYHNWMHAYTVAQYCYQLTQNCKLMDNLEEVEVFALFVACLCHDIDHRGTNNSFQSESKSVLAALYSSEGSVLERHHFAQTMCILNTEGCNIFENLNSRDYQNVLDLLRDIILATDLAHHLKILKNLKEMAERGYNKSVVRDRKMLLCLLMTSCDLSDQTKPWDNTKRVAAMIYKEFFSQGDMEKTLGKCPIEMMDRERAQIPELQIGFLDHVAAPVYKVLSQVFPPVQQCVDNLSDNKRHWEKISTLIKLKRGGSCTQMTFDEVLAIEEETDSQELSDDVISVSNGSN